MNDTLMTPDMCMKFLVWSYYYNDIVPTSDFKFEKSEMITEKQAEELNNIKQAMLLCFTEDSVMRAVGQLRQAKLNNEVCPFSKVELDSIFLK
mgnify:CR=1 FL=1